MKFGIISDLHMEFLAWYPPELDPDVFYLNAGDTHHDKVVRDLFEKKMGERYFAVLGNHDYYGNSFVNADMDFPDTVEVDGIKIAGATLWTEISPTRWWDFKEYMVDSRHISGMTYDRYMLTHMTHKEHLFNSGADVWVVHHLPSYQSVHPKYKDSGGNDFFATELSYKILEMKKPPKLIVHGHTHDRCDYMIGDTRVVCHPRGYPHENDWYKNYRPLIVEV